MKTIKNISYGSSKEQVLDVCIPDNNEFDVFVYFNGGGLESGSKDEPFIP